MVLSLAPLMSMPDPKFAIAVSPAAFTPMSLPWTTFDEALREYRCRLRCFRKRCSGSSRRPADRVFGSIIIDVDPCAAVGNRGRAGGIHTDRVPHDHIRKWASCNG